MSPQNVTWSDIDALEDTFMAACDGKADARQALADALVDAPSTMADWPKPVREAWEAGAELVLDSIDRQSLTGADMGLAFLLARTGFDHAILRDNLATAARKVFSDYMDPAGMLLAMGIHDTNRPPPAVMLRWDVFESLTEGAACWYPQHGVGEITEVDGIGNEIYAKFDRPQEFDLAVALDGMVVVRPDSVVAALLAEPKKWRTLSKKDGFASALADSLASATAITPKIVKALLVPGVVSAPRLREAIQRPGKGDAPAPSPAVASRRPTVKAASAASQQSQQRAWYDSRSVQELVDILTRSEPPPLPEEMLDKVESVLRIAAPKPEHAPVLAEAVSRLWQLAADSDWALPLMRRIGEHAVCWNDGAVYAQITDKIAGKLIPSWNGATIAAKGTEYLAKHCMDLPLRLYPQIEKSFAQIPETEGLLMRHVVGRIRGNEAGADMLLWLWKNDAPERAMLSDSILLFRTLAKPVRGSYIKSNKEIRKLLMESQPFQRLVMRDGDPDAIANLVRCVKHLPLFDSGERQSLLVKIVRLFPEARSMVEERRDQPARKALEVVTSYRSFEARRLELEAIVNVKIPANSRAIAHARGFGDLRENAEYKAAKDEQSLLSARREELEDGLHEVKPTDFADVMEPLEVVPGSRVVLKPEEGENLEYFILGLWDSIPEKQMISYEAPLGQLLLSKVEGDFIDLPSGGEAEIISISGLDEELRDWLGHTG
ncbi:MAG: hypothetical protein HOJ57_27705 [Lentisphaerae bacterium]|jgi:transcription elongation GreA/GreB family factor|nr:hypothetical protein [Lentisphaerota bacterium]MBT5609756.1 hypothetical protein [Lentisphaerota bacterium]MBT7061398.1 hypothetical protein [Lentisphaerota bacterium]